MWIINESLRFSWVACRMGKGAPAAYRPIFLNGWMVGTPSDTHSRDPSALPALRTTQKTGAEAPVS
jgi:hypothetical protein